MRQAGCEAGHWLRQVGFTVLGGCGEPWLHWYCAGGLWGALASLVLCWGLWGALALLVLCWGAVGSPGFAGTVLGLWGALAVLGGCGEPWLHWYCVGGLWGALASLVLCCRAVGSPGGWALGKSFLSVPNVANTVFQCRFIRNTFLHVPFEIMMISKVLNVV